jgi:aspartyl-tRNA(Asn)/glutamyl-tRNA(Gln) amidotransferase subunit B
MASLYGDWEPVIGLEVHAQLLTRTKLFCPCAVEFGGAPNTRTCPVCLGLPGALPVPNEAAVRFAAMAGLALGCTVQPRSVFARKNYLYPDLPKGYQISQYEQPLSLAGHVDVDLGGTRRRARVQRVHLEEDAGKNLHGVGGDSVVDLNRAGTPLIEIVGEPDLRSGEEASEYLKQLREVLMAIGVNDGNLEQGSFRCDANVSVRKQGETELRTRTELKNINSFKFVGDAIDSEVRRQIALYESGDRPRQQTRGYSPDKKETYVLRDKEGDVGYRYFPDPDLPPLVVDEAWIDGVRRALPELPEQKRTRWVAGLGLTPYAAKVLTAHPAVAKLFEDALAAWRALGQPDPVKLANFVQAEVLRDLTTRGLEASSPLSAVQIAGVLDLVHKGAITGKQAKELYAKIAGTDRAPADVVAEQGMTALGDRGAVEAIAREVIAASAKQVAAYKAGKTALLGYLVGQVMRASRGRADPALVNEVLLALLAE